MSKDYGFNIVRKGYDPEEVAEYIENLENVIKSYKEKDSAIKNAILSAQVAADSIVLNAKNEAKAMRVETVKSLDDINKKTEEYVKQLKAASDKQKNTIQDFKNEYEQMLSKYLKNVSSSDIDSMINRIDNFKKDVESSLKAIQFEAPKPDDNITKENNTENKTDNDANKESNK